MVVPGAQVPSSAALEVARVRETLETLAKDGKMVVVYPGFPNLWKIGMLKNPYNFDRTPQPRKAESVQRPKNRRGT